MGTVRTSGYPTFGRNGEKRHNGEHTKRSRNEQKLTEKSNIER